ncbi:ankyrin [Piromyces finnis]|uniref:Ankyrin n=1 Tax=Piromyces finnis TaxID=1754191 RepID=A0A1Y1V887_9FUNG|nr:ankyrin [Piromyces finnis]|eukprot:ORX49211.1 ankyrin [Piromyces finnis]
MENKINPTDKIKESDQPENAGHTKLKEKRKVIVEGYPELHYYCIHNKPICIKAYLKNFIEDLNEVGGPENTTPLLLSIKYEKLECVRTLLSYHPDLTIPDNHGDTPLSYLLKNYQRQQSSQLLDLLLPNLSIHQTYGPDHLTPLYYCLKYQNRQGLNYLSKHKDFNINELDKDQNTPLLYLIKLYLEKVVSTKKQALPAPTTPIVKTSEYFKLFEFIGLILLLGANVNYEHPQECKVPLIYAIEKDQIELVELLMFHHANPYYQLPNYLTPLKLTIKQNNVPIAKILLDARYRPQIKKAKNKK